MRTLPLVLACTPLFACSTAPTAPAPLAGETPIVIGTSFPVDSEVLGQTRTLNVHLPMGYEQRAERFPVVYLIDGGVQQDFVPVAGFGTLATLSRQYREFILVGVETVDRGFELTTRSTEPYDVLNIPSNGGADEFRRFIVEEVQPLVEARYRTTGETAVLGESLAGLFIVDTLLRAPDSFDHYIAVSPSVWWQEQALVRSAEDHLSAPDFPTDRSLYLTFADERDIGRGVEVLVAALREHAPEALTWWFDPRPDEHHHTIYHPATLEALRRIFAPRDGD